VVVYKIQRSLHCGGIQDPMVITLWWHVARCSLKTHMVNSQSCSSILRCLAWRCRRDGNCCSCSWEHGVFGIPSVRVRTWTGVQDSKLLPSIHGCRSRLVYSIVDVVGTAAVLGAVSASLLLHTRRSRPWASYRRCTPQLCSMALPPSHTPQSSNQCSRLCIRRTRPCRSRQPRRSSRIRCIRCIRRSRPLWSSRCPCHPGPLEVYLL
jgi:hypothetical protein